MNINELMDFALLKKGGNFRLDFFFNSLGMTCETVKKFVFKYFVKITLTS